MVMSKVRVHPYSTHKGEFVAHFRFRFNGASAPTSVIGDGIASVAHTGTGIWTVTLDPEFFPTNGTFANQATLEMDADASLSVIQLGKFDKTAGTLVVRVFTETAGTLAAADIAAGSNNGNWAHITMALKVGSAPDGGGL